MLKILKGVFLAAFAGCCWGSMAVAAQYLFTNCGFEARHLTTLRLIGAGVLLLALQAAFGGFQSILKPFKEKRNIRDVLIYGVGVLLIQYTFFLAIEQSNAGTAAIMVGVGPLFIIGYLRNIRDVLIYGVGVLLIQYTFFLAIEQSNAGTAAIMVGVGPLFIIGYLAICKHRKPVPKEFFCLFLAISGVSLQSNAGTAAIMVGVGPLFIIGYLAICKHRKPVPKEFFCLFLAISGVSLVVTKGNFESLDFVSTGAFWGLLSSAFGAFCTVQPKNVISRVGVSNVVGWGMVVGGSIACLFTGAFWGLLSSAFGAFCTVQPKNVISRVGVSNVVGWGMVVGGSIACLFTNPFAMDVHWTLPSVLCYFQIIAFGTVAAFWCYLKSTEYVIPSITAILGSFEPLSAVALSVIILGATFNSYELLGATAILANMLILAWPSKDTESLTAN